MDCFFRKRTFSVWKEDYLPTTGRTISMEKWTFFPFGKDYFPGERTSSLMPGLFPIVLTRSAEDYILNV